MDFQYPTITRESCGTTTGYRTHHKRGEWPCDACREAKKATRRKENR